MYEYQCGEFCILGLKGLSKPVKTMEGSVTIKPPTKLNIDKIEMVQRWSACFVTNCYDRTASVTDMLNNLGWDSLELRRKRNSLAMMNMLIHNGLAEIEKYKYLTPESHVRTQVIIYIIWYIKLFHPLKTTTNSHSFQELYKRMEQPAAKHGWVAITGLFQGLAG